MMYFFYFLLKSHWKKWNRMCRNANWFPCFRMVNIIPLVFYSHYIWYEVVFMAGGGVDGGGVTFRRGDNQASDPSLSPCTVNHHWICCQKDFGYFLAVFVFLTLTKWKYTLRRDKVWWWKFLFKFENNSNHPQHGESEYPNKQGCVFQ